MTTPIVALMTQIADDWEAVTPPDRTTITYHECDGNSLLAGNAGDRAFAFGLPERGDPVGERGPDMTQVRWQIPITVRFGGSGRSLAARADAVANEINLLMRAIELRSVWPSGVLEVITGAAVPREIDIDTGDVAYETTVTALVEETD